MRTNDGRRGAFILMGLLSLSGVLVAATTASAQENELQRGSQLASGFYGPFFNLSGDS